MLGHLRPYVGSLKKMLAWPYIKLGCSPTSVGLFGVFLALIATLSMRLGYCTIAFCFAFIAMSTDMADGEVARLTRTQSPQGNYVDALGDRLREGILLFGLLPLAPNMVSLALLATFLTSYAKARCSLVVMMDNSDWPGFGDHADRGVLLLVAYLLAPNHLWPILLLAISTCLCFCIRVKSALSRISRAKEEELLPYLRTSAKYQR